MTLWLVVRDPNFHKRERTAKTPRRRINLDVEPSPIIMANSVRGATTYHIEDDGMPPKPPTSSKPPYRVPSMREIARVKPSGLSVVTTFAGCGGSSLGYRMAGYKILWANEFVPAAREVYMLNAAKGTTVDGSDIRSVDPRAVMRYLKLGQGELDLLDGSPPCSDFSTAGKRSAGWGKVKKYSDVEQRVDDLFFEFIRFVEGFKPKVFVAENVSGLVKGVAKGYFLNILAGMKALGYDVEARLLDAQWLGVPQQRQRVIFVGVREDLGLKPAFPSPLKHQYSVRDALPWVGSLGTKKGSRSSSEPAPTVLQHGRKNTQSELTIIERETDISQQAIGREYDKLNHGEASSKYFNLVRSDPSSPAPTITAAGGMNSGIACAVHPTEKRKFSIAELKRICAFPDDFKLTGTYAQQWERLGRAVPPLMMKAIAEAVRDRILLPARTPSRAARSPGRSTTGSPPKGAARTRTTRPNAAPTGKPVP